MFAKTWSTDFVPVAHLLSHAAITKVLTTTTLRESTGGILSFTIKRTSSMVV